MTKSLVLIFKDPTPLPANGFIVKYRIKGIVQQYMTQTFKTGSPITITDGLVADTDYEGTIESVCGTKHSVVTEFVTKNYTP